MKSRYHFEPALLVSFVAVILIFIVPLLVPMRPVIAESASYRAGFNNAAAVYAAAGLSLLVFFLTLWTRGRDESRLSLPSQKPLGIGFVSVVLVASAIVLAVCGWVVAASHTRYLGDAGYVIEQATVRRDTGRLLYSQLEFAYGPLLLLPEVWVSRVLHCGMQFAYFSVLVIESTVGLLMAAYLLNVLPIRTRLKQVAFVLLAFGALTPHLGVNYTYFRFAAPFAVLLFGLRREVPWQSAAALSAGEALVVLISPELGLAMGLGIAAYGLLSAFQGKWGRAAVAMAPLCVLGIFVVAAGKPYSQMIRLFSSGALNLPVGPYPHILLFIFALVWLVPSWLGRAFREGDSVSGEMIALYFVCLALTPAALRRCDPLHVMFDGFGVVLLSLVVVSRDSRFAGKLGVAAMALFVLWAQYVNQRQFVTRTKYVLAQALGPRVLHMNEAHPGLLKQQTLTHLRSLTSQPETTYALNPRLLAELSTGGCVATPIEVSPRVEEQLRGAGIYGPGYYAFWVDVLNPSGEQRSIEDANRCSWMLLPYPLHIEDLNTTATLLALQGMKLPYRERNPPLYFPGKAFEANLATHWSFEGTDGPYGIYKNMLE